MTGLQICKSDKAKKMETVSVFLPLVIVKIASPSKILFSWKIWS